jgi:hypothetical protein
VRPLRITKKRVVVSTLALEEFLVEFTPQVVDAIETVWDYAYAKKDEQSPGYDEDDEVDNALIDVEIALETLRDLFSARSDVPQGGRRASQVLVGRRAGTITIVRRSSPDDLENQAAREMAAELLGDDDAEPAPASPVVTQHEPRFPDEDDLEPVFVELLEARYAVN